MPEVYEFDRALLRTPARSVTKGLRADDRGDPSHAGVLAEHAAYAAALRAAGVAVTILPPLEDFPDSVFVEDPALVFTQGAILLRPGAASRAGETALIAPVLREAFATVLDLPAPGFADGGDVLVTPRAVLIGLSARTDRAGAAGLSARLAELGLTGEIVQTPPGVLHFKTDCALLDAETVLVTHRLAGTPFFPGLRELVVPRGEEPAANALRVNDTVFVGAEYPRTAEMLAGAGYRVVPLPTREIGRIDAGLSCMSLRWRAA